MGTTYNAIFRNGKKIADATGDELNALKNTKATTGTFGLGKITQASDVTETGSGLVLGGVEKNASVSGTLANRIADLQKGNFNNYTELTLESTKYGITVSLQRFGRLVLIIVGSGNTKIEISSASSIISNPMEQKYRPLRDIVIPILSSDGLSRFFTVTNSGLIYHDNMNPSIPANSWMRGSTMYISLPE